MLPEQGAEAVQTETQPTSSMSIEDRFSRFFDNEPSETTQEAEAEPKQETAGEDDKTEVSDEVESYELEPEELSRILGAEGDALSLDDEGNIKFRVKVDGESSSVDLKTLIKGYQLEQHVNRKSEEVSNARKVFEAEAEKLRADYQTKLSEAEALTNAIESRLVKKYQSVDWQRLRVENPAEFAASYAEMQADINDFNALKNGVSQRRQYELQAEEAKLKEAKDNWLRQEFQTLIEKVPSWANKATLEQEIGEISKEMARFGVSAQEIQSVEDHRMFLAMRELVSLRKQLEGNKKHSETVKEKKVVKVPKIVKPGNNAKPSGKDSKIAEARARLKKTGRNEDFVAALNQIYD